MRQAYPCPGTSMIRVVFLGFRPLELAKGARGPGKHKRCPSRVVVFVFCLKKCAGFLNMERFNCGGTRFGVDFVIGLYHPESLAISAHGAFVAVKINDQIRTCTFHAGIQFPALCPSNTMLEHQVSKLVNEGWKWMTPNDIYVCCCGMALPGSNEPFWTMEYYQG